MSVITLGGLAGGGARVLGPIIAERFNADYLDRIFLSNVARDLGTTVSAYILERSGLPLEVNVGWEWFREY